jgi:hypothetical protein
MFAVKQGRAMLIDYEMGSYEIRRRLNRIAIGRDLGKPPIEFVTMPVLSLCDAEFFRRIETIASTHGFIGIDSLAAGGGGLDENDARFAYPLYRLKAIAEKTGCAIVVLHHTKKDEGDDPRKMLRGTGNIYSACDVVFVLMKGQGDRFVMHHIKSRGGPTRSPVLVHVEDKFGGGTVVVGTDAGTVGEQDSKAVAKCKKAILLLLVREHGLKSRAEVYEGISGSKPDKIKALDALLDVLMVVRHDGAFRLASDVD